MMPFVLPFCSIRGKKISDAGPSAGDRLFKDLPHNPVEPFNFTHGKPVDLDIRV
jgi:hypothetical protein